MDEIALSVFTDEELAVMRVALFTDREIMEVADIVKEANVSVRVALSIWAGESI